MNTLLSGVALTLVSLSASMASAGVSVGQPMQDVHLPALLNGDGRASIGAFLGQPVVVMDWEMSNPNSLQYGVAKARDLHEKHASKGLVVILHELTRGADIADVEAFLLRVAPGPRVPVCTAVNLGVERVGEQFIPRFAVIGVDGTLVEEGVVHNEAKQLEAAIRTELGKLKSGWGESRKVKKARALLHGKGDVAGALAVWNEMAAEGDAQGEAAALKAEIDRRLERFRIAAEHDLENGECARAVLAIDALATAAEGLDAWQEPIAALREKISSDEFAAELALEKKVVKIARGMEKKRPKAATAKKLEKLAGEAPGTSVARRALRLADRVTRATSG